MATHLVHLFLSAMYNKYIIIKLARLLKLIFNYLRWWGLLRWYNCMSLIIVLCMRICDYYNTMTIHNGYRHAG